MNRSKTLLILGGVGAVAVFGIGWYLTSGTQSQARSQPTGAQNAVNPNAQIGAGAYAQGTMPDIGNLLSYNQVPGAISVPQATSVVSGVWGSGTSGGDLGLGTLGAWTGSSVLGPRWTPVGAER